MVAKQAQFKIQVMAFVLIAVFLLGALCLLMFAQFQSRAAAEQARLVREKRAIALLHGIAALPELGCAGLDVAWCADIDKLEAWKNKSYDESYKRLWGKWIKRVIIEQVYPPNEKNYTIYDSKEPGDVAYSTLIPLCQSTAEGTECNVSRIEIWYELPK